ncbi:MAG: glycosyltransferase family 2 protein [Elusimicrobia bacterium]|nr:glycosyltransferase family 2 protein [Elusimicrobiota bacterium]
MNSQIQTEHRPKVSVVVPVYNHQNWIAQCIESVLAQTMPDWEMIIVDDGSTDETQGVIARYQDPRIHYNRRVHLGFRGLARHYNYAYALACGEFLAILDGDDYWAPRHLETLLPAFQNDRVVMAYGIAQCVNTQGREIPDLKYPSSSYVKKGFPEDVLYNRPIGSAIRAMLHLNTSFPAPGATLFRRSIMDEIGGFDSPKNQASVDWPAFFRFGLKGEFGYVPRVVSFYRRHSGNHTNNFFSAEAMAEGLRDYIEDFLGEHGSDINMTPIERAKILFMWRNNLAGIKTVYDRQLLLQRQWRQARKKFSDAFWLSRRPTVTVSAAMGYTASLFGLDLEGFYGFLGKAMDKGLWSESSAQRQAS